MTGNSFENMIRPRINNILAVSDYMQADILQRYGSADDSDGTDMDPFSGIYSVPEDYSFGWKSVIEQTIMNSPPEGFIFTGSDGCGKHTAAEIACNILLGNGEYTLVYLSCDDFLFTEAEQQADESDRQKKIEKGDLGSFTDDIIHSFFERIFSELDPDVPICLVIDDTEGYDKIEAVYRRLSKYLCISQPSLFVIIIEKNDECIPSLLRKRLRLIRMSAPTQRQRLSLIKNALNGISVIDSETIELLSKTTEDYTYSQLRDLTRNIRYYVLTAETIPADYFTDTVYSQYPLTQRDNGLAEEKIRLYQKLQSFIDMVPELLQRMPAASVTAIQTAETSQKNDDMRSLQEKEANLNIEQEKEKNRIESECQTMKLSALVELSLGKERMRSINIERSA